MGAMLHELWVFKILGITYRKKNQNKSKQMNVGFVFKKSDSWIHQHQNNHASFLSTNVMKNEALYSMCHFNGILLSEHMNQGMIQYLD